MRSVLLVLLFSLANVVHAGFALNVTKSGDAAAAVTVSSAPGGISCGGTCSAQFDAGTQVTLTLSGVSGGFKNWGFSGDCMPLPFATTCTLTMNGPKSVEAYANYYIEPILTWFSVMKSGSGSGTVKGDSGRIDCGATCSASHYSTDRVTVTAMPDPGSVFAGWSGGGCEGVLSCTAGGGASVTATFNLGTPTARPVNVSTRGQVQSGFEVMIGGFVINGAAPKTVVVRAIGPSLANYGVSGALANPKLELVRDGAVVASNDDWQSGPDAARIRAVGLGPSHALESAVMITIPAGPGGYTAIVSDTGGGSGVGLVEVYEVDHPEIPIINLSTRGRVEGGFGVMIGGFVVLDGPQTVILRAIGPTLANYGVAGALANPTMQLVRINDNAVIATNDDWGASPNAAQIQALGFAPSSPLESAMLVTLQPGAYTAVISGVGGATGVGLFEVYQVPSAGSR